MLIGSDSKWIARCRSLLRSCALGQSPASYGHQLHAELLKTGMVPSSENISAAIFHMYATCGPPGSAVDAFSGYRFRATAADWTALISCHYNHNLFTDALRLFRSMLQEAVFLDEVSLLPVLSTAARLEDPLSAASAHLLFVKLGLPFPTHARNAAVHAYANSGRMPDARRLFLEIQAPTVISWTILLTGAVRWEGITVATEVFAQMPERNEVTWTVMVSACIEACLPRIALSLLAQMFFSKTSSSSIVSLNQISLCSLLSACSQAGDLVLGRWVHCHFMKSCHVEVQHLVAVHTALIDMYGKCGKMPAARKMFEAMPNRNVVAWNAMLSVLSMHGIGTEVLELFDRMVREEHLQPDDITFVGVLSACSRSGLVKEGQKLFDDLSCVYGLTPKVEHYACMADLLGRAGKLEEAEKFVIEMPILPNEIVLGSLLASTSLHKKPELGRRIMQRLSEINPQNTEYHVLLSNMYACSGKNAEADETREELWREGVRKTPGISFIEIQGSVHQFCAGDKSHAQTKEVYTMLDEMARRLRLAGYVPNASSQISHSSDKCYENGYQREEREQALMFHSERLAIAFGLISTRPGMPLRIFKNLRICCDCHCAIKLISEIFSREIIIRDRNRFHCFKQGSCSCSDYW